MPKHIRQTPVYAGRGGIGDLWLRGSKGEKWRRDCCLQEDSYLQATSYNPLGERCCLAARLLLSCSHALYLGCCHNTAAMLPQHCLDTAHCSDTALSLS